MVSSYYKKLTKILCIVLIVLVTSGGSVQIYSQTNNVTLISGTLFSSTTREPVQTTISFVDELGKEIKVKSENNGQYQAVIKSGEKYVVTAENYLIDAGESDVELPAKNGYAELRKNFELLRIEPGMELFAIDAFGENKEVLNADALTQILKLKSFLKLNSKVKVKILLSGEDTYLVDGKKTIKEPHPKNPKKMIKKTITISAKVELEKLVYARVSNLKDILTSLKILENRYSVDEIMLSAEKPITKSKKSNKNKSMRNNTDKAKAEANNSGSKLITLKIVVDSLMRL